MASNVANIKIRNHNCKQGRAHLKYKLRAFLINLFGELYKTVGQKTKTKQSELLARARKNNRKGSTEHSSGVG